MDAGTLLAIRKVPIFITNYTAAPNFDAFRNPSGRAATLTLDKTSYQLDFSNVRFKGRDAMTPVTRKRVQIFALPIMLAFFLIEAQASPRSFLYPLQSEHVREAYFLARSHSSDLDAFLNRYVRNFPVPLTGETVQSIEFRTPYELVVQRTLDKQLNYSAQDAQQDFSAHRNLVVVRIVISITPVATQVTSPIQGVQVSGWPTADDELAAERSLDSWYGFHFNVAQEKAIAPKKLTVVGASPPGIDDLTIEHTIDLEFDTSQFSSGTATVEATAPDGKSVRAEFDLDKLK
jgi:hypothetical protein